MNAATQRGRMEDKMSTTIFYAKGKQECNAAVKVTVNDKGAVASAELDHITRKQLLAALADKHPNYDWSASAQEFGYWIAYGR